MKIYIFSVNYEGLFIAEGINFLLSSMATLVAELQSN